MNPNEVFSQISDIAQFLAGIPSINSGGCGIAAYVMAKKLEERGITVSCAFLDDVRFRFNTNKKALETNSLSSLRTPNHIVLQFEDFVFDCNGRFYYEEWIWYEKEDSLFNLNISVLPAVIHYSEWNPEFNREKEIPRIEESLKIDLSFAIKEK